MKIKNIVVRLNLAINESRTDEFVTKQYHSIASILLGSKTLLGLFYLVLQQSF